MVCGAKTASRDTRLAIPKIRRGAVHRGAGYNTCYLQPTALPSYHVPCRPPLPRRVSRLPSALARMTVYRPVSRIAFTRRPTRLELYAPGQVKPHVTDGREVQDVGAGRFRIAWSELSRTPLLSEC